MITKRYLDIDPLVTVKAQISSIRKSHETKLNYSRTGIRAMYEMYVFTIHQYLLYGSMFNTNYLEFGARSECACKEEFTHCGHNKCERKNSNPMFNTNSLEMRPPLEFGTRSECMVRTKEHTQRRHSRCTYAQDLILHLWVTPVLFVDSFYF